MKSLKLILITIVAVGIFYGCKKDEDPVSKEVRVQYPTITMNGGQFVSINIGGTYTDAGAVAFDSINSSNTDLMPIQSEVDPTTPGLYPVIFEAENSYGFKSQSIRWVAVTNIPADEDISGVYARTANGVEVNIDKKARGIYSTDNVGGVPGDPSYLFPVYFVQLNDTDIVVPPQPGGFGEVSAYDTRLTKSPSDTTIQWVVDGAGFGTALRVFSRQR